MTTLSLSVAGASALLVFAVALRFWNWRRALAASLVTLFVVPWLFPPAANRTRPLELPQNESLPDPVFPTDFVPAEEPADGYISSATCAECHAEQHHTWYASYHRTMTQRATPEAVFGDFSDHVAHFDGVQYVMSHHDGEFQMQISDPPGRSAEASASTHTVVLATGSHHMQVYWTSTGSGRTLAELPIYFLREDKRWIPRSASFLVPPNPSPDRLDFGRWNKECLQCHTTHGRSRPHVELGMRAADSKVAEFGISCEACHGPAEEHVRAKREKLGEHRLANPGRLNSHRSAEVCGRCHGITLPPAQSDYAGLFDHGNPFRPGQVLAESQLLVRHNEAARERFKAGILQNDQQVDAALDLQFWRDGMVRVSGREYNGLVESACYQRGTMSCVSCHSMHKADSDKRPLDAWADDQLRPEALEDTSCTQCHAQATYASLAHTHHEESSTGSRCYNCHMPHTTYGLLKAIRSHTISSPNVATDVSVGRPNACNLCHLDRTLEWTATHLEQWYDIAPPKLTDDQRKVSAAVLWMLQGDAGQRALSAWHLGWQPAVETAGEEWLPPHLGLLLDDPYPAVRYLAGKSLLRKREFREFPYDFVAPADKRKADVSRVLDLWRESQESRKNRTGQTALEFPAAVLLNPDASLKQLVIDRLKRLRDNRPVSLVE